MLGGFPPFGGSFADEWNGLLNKHEHWQLLWPRSFFCLSQYLLNYGGLLLTCLIIDSVSGAFCAVPFRVFQPWGIGIVRRRDEFASKCVEERLTVALNEELVRWSI